MDHRDRSPENRLESRRVNIGLRLWVQVARRSMRTDRSLAQEIRFLFPHGVNYLLGLRADIRRWVEEHDTYTPDSGELRKYGTTLTMAQWSSLALIEAEIARSRRRTLDRKPSFAANGKMEFRSQTFRQIVTAGLHVLVETPSLDPRPAQIAKWRFQTLQNVDFLPSFDRNFLAECQKSETIYTDR